MQLYLMRHGIAEDGQPGLPDSSRALTGEGRRKLKVVLAAAAKAGTKPTLILSSPYKRARQTADLAADALGYSGQIVESSDLTPEAAPEEMWSAIRDFASEPSILVTGHQPSLGYLLAFVLGTPSLHVDFKKGAIAYVELPQISARPQGVLEWMLTAKLAQG